MTRRGPTILTLLLAMVPIASEIASAAPGKHLDHTRRPRSGIASFYGRHHAGRTMASGKPFSPERMTAASRTLPLGTKAQVVNKENGRSAQVTITDRGPYEKDRIIDVTPKAARRLGMTDDGTAPVEVKPVALPPTGGR